MHVSPRRATATAAATLSLLLGLVLVTGSPAYGIERGPNPTNALLEASSGPYSVSSTAVSSLATPGFGAADIYYPTTTAEGTWGGVAIAPGFTATRSSMAWLARRVASHGFVVININTNSTYDQPASRGDQLLAALDYLTNTSSARTRVDRNRLAVMGHSMGGGGTLEAAKDRPSLDAVVPLTAWNTDKTWPEIQSPTLVIGAENDSVASVSSHSIPFYNSIPSTTEKAYIELNGASHFAPNSTNTTIGKYSVAWLKRFVDQDLRYEQFLCPIPSISTSISDSRGTCPH
jgi:alpha-beta hydrolase superfamily lysophospholipase